MRKAPKSPIVYDGAIRRRQTPEYKQQVVTIRQTITAEYADRLQRCGLLRRPWVAWRRRREIQRAIDRLLPRNVWY
jgi:hypothetical protein